MVKLWFHFSLQNGLGRGGNVVLHQLKMPYCSKYFQDFSDEHAGMKQKSSLDSSCHVVSYYQLFQQWDSSLLTQDFSRKISNLQQEGIIILFFKRGYARDLPCHCTCVIPRKGKEPVHFLSSNAVILFLSAICCTLSSSLVIRSCLSCD